MHEMAICQALLQQLEQVAAENQANAVRSVTIRVGPLSGVVPDLLKRAFEFARRCSVASSAQLLIESTPVRVHCNECGARTEARVNRLLCGDCGGFRTRVVAGDELLLASVELEPAPQTANPTPHPSQVQENV